MTTGTWVRILFSALSTWASAYAIPPEISAAANGATEMLVYIINDAAGDGSYMYIAYMGGSAIVPASKMTLVSTPTQRTDTWTDDTWKSIRGDDGSWIRYSSATSDVRKLASLTGLATFLA